MRIFLAYLVVQDTTDVFDYGWNFLDLFSTAFKLRSHSVALHYM